MINYDWRTYTPQEKTEFIKRAQRVGVNCLWMGRGPVIGDAEIIQEVIEREKNYQGENMTAREYLLGLISKKQNNFNYSNTEKQVYQQIWNWINEWKQKINNDYNLGVQVTAQESGSRAKSTALKGKSDIDVFVSITDRDNTNTTKEYYNDLHDFFKNKIGNSNIIRRQNVSIGLTYAGCDIDVTPAKRLNSSSYKTYNDHNMWSNINQGLMKTNIQKHIDLVRSSGLQNEIMCIKMWRNCHKLELPSIYIEILAIEVLKNQQCSLNNKVWGLLITLRDTVQTRRIIDPANSNNNIADSMTNAEKQAIAKAAKDSLNQESWSSIIW